MHCNHSWSAALDPWHSAHVRLGLYDKFCVTTNIWVPIRSVPLLIKRFLIHYGVIKFHFTNTIRWKKSGNFMKLQGTRDYWRTIDISGSSRNVFDWHVKRCSAIQYWTSIYCKMLGIFYRYFSWFNIAKNWMLSFMYEYIFTIKNRKTKKDIYQASKHLRMLGTNLKTTTLVCQINGVS